MINFTDATHGYENWLARVISEPLIGTDLDYKHTLFADEFPFFRGTYYRWAQHWAVGPLADAPRVLAVGDLHVENFGTWRDAEGRLCWGVNDFDEADTLAYTNDLVRLAASVRVAHRAGALDVKFEDACDAVLRGYRESLEGGGRPFVLEEHHSHLRKLATSADRDPKKFWEKMTGETERLSSKLPDDARKALDESLPAAGLSAEYRARPRAGVGSLGRPRFVALAKWHGGWVCREAKAAAPPATAWSAGTDHPCRAAVAVYGAVRAPDPFYSTSGRWVVRRLGPKSSRIELDGLKGADLGRVFHAMGAETANVHLGTPGAAQAIRADLDHRQPKKWLEQNAWSLADRMEADWAERRSRHGAGH